MKNDQGSEAELKILKTPEQTFEISRALELPGAASESKIKKILNKPFFA